MKHTVHYAYIFENSSDGNGISFLEKTTDRPWLCWAFLLRMCDMGYRTLDHRTVVLHMPRISDKMSCKESAIIFANLAYNSHIKKNHSTYFLVKTTDGPWLCRGTFINDVPRFLAIFDLPTYLVLLNNIPFSGLSWTPLPTLM